MTGKWPHEGISLAAAANARNIQNYRGLQGFDVQATVVEGTAQEYTTTVVLTKAATVKTAQSKAFTVVPARN